MYKRQVTVNATVTATATATEPGAEPATTGEKKVTSITRQCVGEHEQDFDNTFKIELGCSMITTLDNQWEYVVASTTIRHTAQTDLVMVDSGAQVCVCHKHFAYDIALNLVKEQLTPRLGTATKAPIQVYGVKYIDYLLDNGHWMCVRYYVTDVASPILSLNGLAECDYNVVLGKDPSLYKGKLKVNTLMKTNGLFYIVTSGRQHFTGNTIQSIKTTQTICANEKVPPCGDYWKMVVTPTGTKAVRVHRIPRKYFFTPKSKSTMPGTEKETDPWFHRLGPIRTTRYALETHPTETRKTSQRAESREGRSPP